MATISAKQFLGGKPAQTIQTPATTPATQEPGFLDRVASDLNQRGTNYRNIVNDTKQNPIVGAFKGTAQMFGGIGDTIGEAIKSTPVVNKVAEEAGKIVNKGISAAINYASPVGEQLLKLEQSNPEAAKLIINFLEVASAAGDISGNILLTEGAAQALKTTAKITGKVAGKAAQALPLEETGQALKNIGEKTTGLGVPMEEPTRIALQAYQAEQPTLFERVKNFFSGSENPKSNLSAPTTEANTAVRLLNPGTEWQLGVHAKKVAGDVWDKVIAPALKSSENETDMQVFLQNLKKKIKSETPDLNRRKTLLKGFDAFAEDYKRVNFIGDERLQLYKEGWADFVPEKYYKNENVAGALNQVRGMAADEARKLIYKSLGDQVKQAYLDYGNLKSIAKAGIKSIDQLRSKGMTRQVWEAIMDKAVTPIATTAGKVLYKTGEGLEFIGKAGAKKVKDILTK